MAGINLNNPRVIKTIQRMFYARFAGWVVSEGMDAEDVLQDVYLGIMARNDGKNPWKRGGGYKRSTYIYMVIQAAVRNKVRDHHNAIRRMGVLGPQSDAALNHSLHSDMSWPKKPAKNDG